MASYSTCQLLIHNIELYYGCFTILIVYQSKLSLFMSRAMDLVRLDDLGKDRGSLCFRACSSVLLVHPKEFRVISHLPHTSHLPQELSCFVYRVSGV